MSDWPLPDWMPGAVRKPVPYRLEAGRFKTTPRGWVLHVVVGNGSPFTTFRDAKSPSRRFSTFWIAKNGVIEQYAETWCIPWAQAAGNPYWWAVETEGFPTEPLTPQQIASAARIHRFLKAADTLAESTNGRGVGTHYMGGAAWGGHTCPDPTPGIGPRSKQRAAILAAANNTAQEDDMQLSDKITVTKADGSGTEDIPFSTLLNRMQWVYAETIRQRATEAAQTAAIQALAEAKGADADAITKAVVDKIAALQITLTPKEN